MVAISGNTFIVTGGAGGIGGAVATELVGRGANVVLFDVVPEDKGAAFAKTVSSDKALYLKVDITDSEGTKKAVETAVEKFGNLKGAVHCAGIAVKRPWSNDLSDSISDFQKMLQVNTVGTFIVNAHVADAINKPLNHPDGSSKQAPFWTTDEERGVIINFASAAGHGLYARTLAYGPTKVAVMGITKSFSDFLGPSGIRVNSISPSIVASAMTANFSTYFSEDLKKHATFPRRPAAPSDILPTVVYLIENTFVNGQDVAVDGGWRLVTQKAAVEGEDDPRELAPGLE
ncbi:hypothetical protein BCR35DRAFT_279457 [Leucosporidium creatinivorum]|uniref:NAD(P)-binding protein n=1 Tax=Leucosporidium creatinivorum TaxID=106004 RepID=A0A1Y2F6M8_9BASI|nr:hypothetical protein BCR35DRAFT_279457 [Leucosporidium creatinivorum]